MIHYFYGTGTLQVGIGQTLCSFEHVSCYYYYYYYYYTLSFGVLMIVPV